jgi:hypothetical protein
MMGIHVEYIQREIHIDHMQCIRLMETESFYGIPYKWEYDLYCKHKWKRYTVFHTPLDTEDVHAVNTNDNSPFIIWRNIMYDLQNNVM